MKELSHGTVLGVAGVIVGILGSGELGPTVPVVGSTLVVGIVGAALTPRLPIW
jgi:hypothetical protein